MQATGIVRPTVSSPFIAETSFHVPTKLLEQIGIYPNESVEIFITDEGNLGIQKYYGDSDNEATSHLELWKYVIPEHIVEGIKQEERARAMKEYESKLCKRIECQAEEKEGLTNEIICLENTVKKLKDRIRSLKSVLLEVLRGDEDE